MGPGLGRLPTVAPPHEDPCTSVCSVLHATNQAWEGFGCSFVWGLLCMLLFLSLSVAGGAFSFL